MFPRPPIIKFRGSEEPFPSIAMNGLGNALMGDGRVQRRKPPKESVPVFVIETACYPADEVVDVVDNGSDMLARIACCGVVVIELVGICHGKIRGSRRLPHRNCTFLEGENKALLSLKV